MKYDNKLFEKLNKFDVGYIYIVKTKSFIKIGIATLPEQRIQLIRTDNPHYVEVLYLKKILNTKDTELEVHSHLKKEVPELHIKGEWYKYDPEVVDWLIGLIEFYMDSNRKDIIENDLKEIFKAE